MALDLSFLEGEIGRIPDVRAVRLVAAPDGELSEVHVLATLGKHAKQLVRDVQSVLLAAGGVEIDHRIVSVVQLRDDEPDVRLLVDEETTSPNDVRLSFDGLLISRRSGSLETMVEIRHQGDLFSASCSADGAPTRALPRVVAQATLDAVSKAIPSAPSIHLEAVRLVDLGEHQAVVTTVRVGDATVAGAAVVRSDGVEDAAARSVLDALNRRLRPGTNAA